MLSLGVSDVKPILSRYASVSRYTYQVLVLRHWLICYLITKLTEVVGIKCSDTCLCATTSYISPSIVIKLHFTIATREQKAF